MPKKFIVPLQNMEKAIYLDTDGKYGTPWLRQVTEYESVKWIPFNYVGSIGKKYKDKSMLGVHFHLHDYQFERLWTSPDLYIDKLKQFKYITSPEFSVYSDMPKAIQVYNHFRMHWVGRYLSDHGITVIPTILWSIPQTFEFCFDGEPVDSVVCISSVGLSNKKDSKDAWDIFWMGWDEMIKRIYPRIILMNGHIPPEIENDVIPLERAYTLFNKEKKE